jgi:hypothetical protein
MSDASQTMDVYSNIRIPFSIAAWCREHRFHPLAASLAKTLRAATENQTELQRLEDKDRTLYGEIKSIVSRIEAADANDTNVKHGIVPKKPHVGVVRRVKPEEA